MAAGMVWWGLVGTQDVNAINCCSVSLSLSCVVLCCVGSGNSLTLVLGTLIIFGERMLRPREVYGC